MKFQAKMQDVKSKKKPTPSPQTTSLETSKTVKNSLARPIYAELILKTAGQLALLTLRIYVQPGASKTCVRGLHGDRLKISIKAPPVEGEANLALCEWLAEEFQISKSKVHLTQGHQSRLKTVEIEFTQNELAQIKPDHIIRNWPK